MCFPASFCIWLYANEYSRYQFKNYTAIKGFDICVGEYHCRIYSITNKQVNKLPALCPTYYNNDT